MLPLMRHTVTARGAYRSPVVMLGAIVVVVTALAVVASHLLGPSSAASPAPSATTIPVTPGVTPTISPVPEPPPTWVQEENRKPGTAEWYVPYEVQLNPDRLGAYTTQPSVVRGEPVTLRIQNALGGRQRVRAYRMGYYGGKGGRLVASSDWTPATTQPDPTLVASQDGRRINMVTAANWKDTLTLDTTDWPEGAYALVIESSTHRRCPIPFMVRSSTVAGRTVMINSTTTWQAYNKFGQHSTYSGPGKSNFVDRSRVVTYDRPYDKNAVERFMNWERPAIMEAERSGVDLAYLTDVDLERGGIRDYPGARAMIMPGHDEYWSNARVTAWTQMRDAGTNFVALTGNIMWWRIRWHPGMRTYDIYKAVHEDPRPYVGEATGHFDTVEMVPVLGSRYVCNDLVAAMEITEPDFWAYEGTGVTKGEKLPGLIRHEPDAAFRIPGLQPSAVEVPSHTRVHCKSGGRPVVNFADTTYYTAPSGAGVLKTSTAGMALALNTSPGSSRSRGITARSRQFARTFFQNVVVAASQGPLGQRHPVRSNLLAVVAPAENPAGRIVPNVTGPGYTPIRAGTPGDLTGDRNPDLVSVSESVMTLETGEHSGRLVSQGPASTGWSQVTWMSRAGDLNLDGGTDVLAVTSRREMVVAHGLGRGRFKAVFVVGRNVDTPQAMAVVPRTRPGRVSLLLVDRSGALIRREVGLRGVRPTQKVLSPKGWDDVEHMVALGQGSAAGPHRVLAFHADGRLTIHQLTDTAIGAGREMGNGWTNLRLVAMPGAGSASPRQRLVIVRQDGTATSYALDAQGVPRQPVELDGDWSKVRLIG